MLRAIAISVGITLSIIISFISFRFDLPVYPDAIGTMGITFLCGIFPGIMTAMLTDVFSLLFNENALYFSVVNVIIAIYSAWYIRGGKRPLRNPKYSIIFVLSVGFIGGLLSGLIQWALFGEPQNESLSILLKSISPGAESPGFFVFLAANCILNIIEKGVSLGIIMLLLHFVPEETQKRIRNSGWRQRPLATEEAIELDKKRDYTGVSIRKRLTLMLVLMSLAVAAIVGGTVIRLYYDNAREELKKNGYITCQTAAMAIDADQISDFIREGRDAEGYEETADRLYYIWRSASDVKYLYVVTLDEDYVTFVFDVEDRESDDAEEAYEVGEKVPIEDAFRPYMSALLAGEEIDPVESNGNWSWLITVYYPVRNSSGETVCYVGTDCSLNYLADYMGDFSLRVLLIVIGFIILIVAYGLWTTGLYLVYPMKSMTRAISVLIKSGTVQDKLDDSVKKIRRLDISTGDELETLYQEICAMASNQAEQLRSVRRLADSTAKMQDGLIITMADMVENRDSDTGAHIQKTAAYVQIIVESLKKKGYYPEKINEKYMSDVVRSAPLHDVGKINIPDNVLNKPGKLTDEEYEIMKMHTIFGRKIIEKTIDTMEGDNYLKEARNMAAYHHERWDGKGYPEGLHGEVIPLSARIMAVADVFDALTSPRVYKPGFPIEKALAIIEEGKGTQFDPKCVEAFMDSLDEVKIILRKFNGV